VFEVSQFDSYAYLFDAPFFVILDDAASPNAIPLAGMRIGLNGRVISVGQAYSRLNVSLNSAAYDAEGRQVLSTLGTIIPLEQGPDQDEFFLSFERLGNATNVVVEADPVPPPASPDLPVSPRLGVRDFAEINASMARMTGVPTTHAEVAATYQLVHQALPVQANLGGFISSQQMGITQLAIKYCSVLVDDPTLRSQFWPGFNFAAPLGTAFDDRAAVLDPIVDRMIGRGIATQPAVSAVEDEVNDLIDRLRACGGSCESDRVSRIMKASCASVLGSAAMLVH
jgi:hypothetical protein